MSKKVKISGAGCCLVDQIHPRINFASPVIERYRSKSQGDGGLHPGRLVFTEQFEAFSSSKLKDVISEISKGGPAPVLNIGGPSVVSLIHAAQLLQDIPAEVSFHGLRGEDNAGDYMQSQLEKTPLNLKHFKASEGDTPSTIVLSDPEFNNRQGERIFVNDIGAAWNFKPGDLSEAFFDSDIVVFGGTALVPALHDGLTDLLIKAKNKGCITVVNTVYDFHSELERPGQKWKLGQGEKSYRYIDLLIMDAEEALNLSGKKDLVEASSYFMELGVSSFIITNGTKPTGCYSDGKLFAPVSETSFPVSDRLVNELKNFQDGDTTGCGDNFVGGVLASMAWQIHKNSQVLNLEDLISWGTVSGGYCCYQVGGTYIEEHSGEKLALLHPYYENYKIQITKKPSILIFGAGKIGRSFLGQLFGKAGFGIVFVDMDETLVHELNHRGSYPVLIKGPDKEENVLIENVSAIHAIDSDRLNQAICEADIMAISVGKSALPAVAKSVAAGLLVRENIHPGRIIDIILAENMRSADQFFRESLREILPDSYALDHLVGLVETSIGKMVPILTSEDIEKDKLQVFAEPYNTLILDKKGFKGKIPAIKEFSLKENMKAWVDRKAFIHNLGHASAAYCGYLQYPDATYLHDVLTDDQVLKFTRTVMEEAAQILQVIYPDEFSTKDLQNHIEDLLERFRNKNLGDTIFRVGCDLRRKLGKNDRFMGVIQLANKTGMPGDRILEAFAMGFHFKGKDEFGNMLPGDVKFQTSWSKDPDFLLTTVCGIQDARQREAIKELVDKLSG